METFRILFIQIISCKNSVIVSATKNLPFHQWFNIISYIGVNFEGLAENFHINIERRLYVFRCRCENTSEYKKAKQKQFRNVVLVNEATQVLQ